MYFVWDFLTRMLVVSGDGTESMKSKPGGETAGMCFVIRLLGSTSLTRNAGGLIAERDSDGYMIRHKQFTTFRSRQ